MQKFLGWLFFCSHRNYSFPLTQKPGKRRPEAAMVTGTYVACLECGKELAYDWVNMRVVRTSGKLTVKIEAKWEG